MLSAERWRGVIKRMRGVIKHETPGHQSAPAELTVPILLVHGMYDKFVPMDEDQRMAEVREETRTQI